jgi:membrane protease YdiL (CAAX protease family)
MENILSIVCSVALIAIGTSRVWWPDGRLYDKRDAAILSRLLRVGALAVALFLFCFLLLSAHQAPEQPRSSHQSLSRAGSIVAVAAWHPLTRRISAWWPHVAEQYNVALPTWVYTGPLGKGCCKVVEALLACLLWQAARGTIPLIILPKDQALSVKQAALYTGVLLAFSIAVNMVLNLWSKTTGSKGDHAGLKEFSKQRRSSMSESTIRGQIELVSLAAINAACEECTSRGFWRHEFVTTAHLSWSQANIAQAIIFGVWHFHGVPSGWIGVGLTFVYGLLMGWMSDWSGGGLVLPILTHTVANYYIFAVIVRQKEDNRKQTM